MASSALRNVALLGATGVLGSHILKALASAGYAVTAIQRKDSQNAVPDGIQSVKVDLSSQEELQAAFQGKDAVISAVPNPVLKTEKIMIDASIAASVKRIIASEFSTNIESPLSRKLPIVKDKVEIREYLESAISNNTSVKTTWSSVNNGPFFDMGLKFGFLGPNVRQKNAVFHDGGEKVVCATTLKDIAAAVVKSLDEKNLEATKNKPVYVYSTPITEKKLTEVVSKVTGIDFGSIEGGQIPNRNVEQLKIEADEAETKGDHSKRMDYYMVFMYGKGYGGDFRDIALNEKLGLGVLSDQELEQAVREVLDSKSLKAF